MRSPNRLPHCILGLVIGSLLSLVGPAPAPAAEPDFGWVEQQFCHLPLEARSGTGPLFWLHGDESQERLEKYVGKAALANTARRR